ncbi:hypothetical protein V8E36_008849 [Tilletia maclaganii]
MAKVLGRRWVRLWWDSGTTPVRICAGSRSVSSSSAVPAAAAAAAAAAHTRAVDHIEQGSAVMRVRVQEDSASSTATMSEKARGKQRARSSEELDSGTSPYMRGSRLHATFGSDMDELTRLASSADGPESARAWLEVLQNPAASYSTSAPYLLTQGAFYCSPLQGAGGRGFLARLHCHLLACQIHSAADAELALKMLKRHCVLGSSRPHSLAAWPSAYAADSAPSTSQTKAEHIHSAQARLMEIFARNTALTTHAITVTLERTLRDVRVTHLVFLCVRLIVQLTHRFRAQLGPAPQRAALHRGIIKSKVSKLRQPARWLRRQTHRTQNPNARVKAEQHIRPLFIRTAHLLAHRGERRHTRAAIILLKASVVLSNVHMDECFREENASKVRGLQPIWPNHSSSNPTQRLREQRASNLPRRRVPRNAVLDVDHCRDVARALLDGSPQHGALGRQRHGAADFPLTTPLRLSRVDDHGRVTLLDPAQGLRSSKMTSFLTFALARACVFAVAASTMLRRRSRLDRYEDGHLLAADYDCATRAFQTDGLQADRTLHRRDVTRRLLALAEHAELREKHWTSRQRRTAQRLPSRERTSSRTDIEQIAVQRATAKLWSMYADVKMAAMSRGGDYKRERSEAFRDEMRTFLRVRDDGFLHFCFPSLRDAKSAAIEQVKTAIRQSPRSTAFNEDTVYLRQAIAILVDDENTPISEILQIFAPDAAGDISERGDGSDLTADYLRRVQDVQSDSKTVAEVIFILARRNEWHAIELIWQQLRHMRGTQSFREPFDLVSRAYLRSQITRSTAIPPHQRLDLIRAAILQVTQPTGLHSEQHVAGANGLPRQGVVSQRLARDIIYFSGIMLGSPSAALKYWSMLHARDPETAFGWRPFAAMLQCANAAERERIMSGEDGGGGGSPFWSRERAERMEGSGMAIRRLFRQQLFQQHPSLAPWSETAPLNPLAEIDAGGRTGQSSISLLGSVLLKVAVKGGSFFPWSSSTRKTGQASAKADALSSVSAQPHPAPAYINFNEDVFEAYMLLLHTMSVPMSPLVSARPRHYHELRHNPVYEPEDGGIGGSTEMLSSGTTSTDTPTLLYPSSTGTEQAKPQAQQQQHDTLASEHPQADELLLVLAWMKRLHVRPTRVSLCLLCLHLLETLPPGLIKADAPAGPLTEWLEGWLSYRSVPTEEDVGRWLRWKRHEISAVSSFVDS